jgi:polysaccharide export outer membrane protein
MFKAAAAFITLLFTYSLLIAPAAAQKRAEPAALIQYVRDARKAGLTDEQIRENAQRAGWTADSVTRALADSRSPAPAGEKAAPEIAPEKAASAGPVATAETPATARFEFPAAAAGGTPAARKAAPELPKQRNAPDDYVIGAGDVLQISVWREPDASVQSAVVRPDGKISMPLLKEVPVQGLTVVQAEHSIADQLSKFLTAPDVTIVVQGINSKKIYITGAVKKEGPIPYTYRMTVLQAITEAGGLTDYAKRKKIYVLHDEDGRQFTFPFDYDAVLKGQHMESNRYLTPGDTVVVPH